jgi:riboflavin kinase / FMN adenylyltransferase
MQVTWLPDVERRPRNVALGEFDGVHVGHREVIRGADTVVTFEPHPRAVLTHGHGPALLTALDVKADLVAGLGVRELVVIRFDEAFAALAPEAFVQDVLVDRLGATRVSVGADFRFGKGAKGDVELLRSVDAFETRVADMVDLDGRVVSSTHLRSLIATGDVATAARGLGAPWELRGEVVHGDKRGRTLGYPTANIVPDPSLVVPSHGIYACRATLPDGTVAAAATNVGVRPTFDSDRGLLVEAFLLDTTADLYGSVLRLQFLERLRGEQRFDSIDALVEQMGRDTEQTRRLVTLPAQQ